MPSKHAQFYYKNNRLQQLRGFCYAAQFGSITKAAAHMGLNQSSVSLQIKALEEELGASLFRRNGPQIALTTEGVRLLNMALPHIDGIQNICDVFHQELGQARKTELSIGVNASAKSYLMPPVVHEYIKSYSDIYITLHFAEYKEAAGLLENQKIDCAVLPQRAHAPFPKDWLYTPVYFFKPSLITRHDHPLAGRSNLSIEEISRYELILPAEELRVIPNLYEAFPQHNINKKHRVNFKNMETGREYIENGLIITISSNILVRPNDPILKATPLPHLFDDVDYGFVTLKDTPMPEKVKSLIAVARDQAKHLM